MFKKHALQVTMVKKPKTIEEAWNTTTDTDEEELILFVEAAVSRIIQQVSYCVFGYIALDTVRKVIIAKASH